MRTAMCMPTRVIVHLTASALLLTDTGMRGRGSNYDGTESSHAAYAARGAREHGNLTLERTILELYAERNAEEREQQRRA